MTKMGESNGDCECSTGFRCTGQLHERSSWRVGSECYGKYDGAQYLGTFRSERIWENGADSVSGYFESVVDGTTVER